MGWSVHVTEVVLHVATCAEPDCDFAAEPTTREEAESQARQHRNDHERRHRLYEELLETGHSQHAAEAVRLGRAVAEPDRSRPGHLRVLWPKGQ